MAAELEQIVKAELREPIEQLVRQVVRELVQEQLNGAATPTEIPVPGRQLPAETTNAPTAAANPGAASTDQATKVCTICGETKSGAKFEPGRHQCKACRNRKYARKREPPNDEEPPG